MPHANSLSLKNASRKKTSPWLLLIALCLLMILNVYLVKADNVVVGDGTPASCTESAFAAAITTASSGGGVITFNCGSNPHTIILTSAKNLSTGIVIDGGNMITLSGNHTTRLLQISGTGIELHNLNLAHGQAGNGAAIWVTSGAQLTVSHSQLSQNQATNIGGGLYNDNGSVTLTNVTLATNQAIYGGGIYNSGTITLNDVTLDGNTATSGGGGIYNHTTATLMNSTMSANESGDGGGVFNAGTVALSNSTLSGNQANFGGGIFNNGTATIINVTIAENDALGGGGGLLHNSGVTTHLHLTNTLLALNTAVAPNTDQCLLYEAAETFVYNLWSGTSCGSSTTNGNQPDTEALLAPLGFTGTGLPTELTMTHALLFGSPAVDTGTCDNGVPTTDQRGMPRPQGPFCDIGAVEMTPVAPSLSLFLPLVQK